MKTLKSENKLCLMCMEQHDVATVQRMDTEVFKGLEVSFPTIYEYCSNADEFMESEKMIKSNNLAMKDAYRRAIGLLTSEEIQVIREIYGVSQKDFSEILRWGRATITRYENHQVQDRAHDDVLRKIADDPKWFLSMLKRNQDNLSEKAYEKYLKSARLRCREMRNSYMVEAIKDCYTDTTEVLDTGGVKLNIEKIVEMINYLASNVTSLHKVKLMKMLWYSDALHYKRNGKSISGMAYCALPMGAVPLMHEQIVLLDGVEYETVPYGEDIGYRFKPALEFKIAALEQSDIEAMDTIISELGHLNARDIVTRMHDEDAYHCTDERCIISYSHAKKLTLE